MKWFLKRLGEASSYAGLGLISTGGLQVAEGRYIEGAVALVTGIIAFVRGEPIDRINIR